MTNRKKAYIAIITIPITILLLGIVIVGVFFDTEKILSNPKEFVTENFPTFYNDIKDIALNSGGENIPAGIDLNVPLIKIKLSRNDNAHFSDLMGKFNSPDYGVNYYATNNVWRKAELEFDGKEYTVKIKAHGREPTGHQEGSFISLAVKMPEGELIFGANRFSLIVRSRIYTNRIQSLALAEYLDILHQPEKLVRVKLKGQDEKYFFFEKKFDNKLMENQGLSSLRRLEYSATQTQTADKSLVSIIDQNAYTEQELTNYLIVALKEEGIPESHYKPIISKYLAINKAISSRSIDVGNYFDPEYLAKFEALRIIQGFVGHGWMKSNFFLFYNQADGLFYPGITRDNKPSKLTLTDNDPIEKQLNSWDSGEITGKFTFPFFDALSKDDALRQRKYKAIYKIIKDYPSELREIQNSIYNKFNSIHNYGWASPILQKLGQFSNDLLPHNLSILDDYLSTSSPTINVLGKNEKLTFIIEPNSMSAIGFDQLNISGLAQYKTSKANVSLLIENGKGHIRYPLNTNIASISEIGALDLTETIRNIDMSTALDDHSDRVTRKYIIIIEAKNVDFSPIELNNINLIVRNRIVDAIIPKNGTTLSLGTIQNLPDPSSMKHHVLDANEGIIAFHAIQKQFPAISMSRSRDNQLVIHSGNYEITKDFIIPHDLKLILEAGTTLLLGENVALMGYKGVDIRGTNTAPVTITALDPQKPYGTFGFLGTSGTTSTIDHLHQSHGNERWVNGVFFSGGFSIHYNDSVTLRNSQIKDNHADDGANFKYAGNVLIEDTLFQDNFADQIDLDYTNAYVKQTRFLNTLGGDLNGDGLDISGSSVIVAGTTFDGFNDKGISVGENSEILVYQSILQNNNNGAAVKDRSNAYFINVAFHNNKNDISSYMKKRIFGGANVFLESLHQSESPLTFNFDDKSKLHFLKKKLNVSDMWLSTKSVDFDYIFDALDKVPNQMVPLEATYIAEDKP